MINNRRGDQKFDFQFRSNLNGVGEWVKCRNEFNRMLQDGVVHVHGSPSHIARDSNLIRIRL